MFVVTDAEQWAQENFGSSDLGDKRRSARLVRMAGDLARHAGSSLLKACDGDEAAAEGMYRLLRNEEVDPGAIAEGGFQATVRRAGTCEVLLAVEDSTSLVYRHSVAGELGTTGNNAQAVNKGFIVHSVVLLDGGSGATVGLIEQRRWKRAVEEHGKKHQRQAPCVRRQRELQMGAGRTSRTGAAGRGVEQAGHFGVRPGGRHHRVFALAAAGGWSLRGARCT